MNSLSNNEKIECDLLLRAIFLKYGYDFRDYSESSIRRRIKNIRIKYRLKKYSDLQDALLHDKVFFNKMFLDMTINVTEMFRNPIFFKIFRNCVVPELKKQPFVKIWHAGCSTGEEVYSMAILLEEEACHRFRIYATDMNEEVILKAKEGVFPIAEMKAYTHNYREAGGKTSFADYYTARYDFAIMDKALRQNIVFFYHNLVNDGVFGEMDLIVCRNVLIYHNKELQNRVFNLFSESLRDGGYLCLGPKESVRFSTCSDKFADIVRDEKIYRKQTISGPSMTTDSELVLQGEN
ncbi:MAG: protein-glutamate O-methyltransferase CheR [Planctomycetes bacterium]|nr:protein-glutamate O-methyltransferase CheR [Planctomycetota bacterium]